MKKSNPGENNRITPKQVKSNSLQKPEFLDNSSNVDTIVKEFEKTGKYSKQFLNALKNGLNKSTYFKRNK